MAASESRTEVLETQVCGVRLDVGELKTQMEAMASNIASVQVNVEGVKVRIEAINKKVENLTVDFMSANRDIRYEIKQLQDAQETVITVLEHKKILSGVG